MKRVPGDPVAQEAGGGLLHNMSAPPRMQLTISPFSVQESLLGSGTTAPPGFRLQLSLDLNQLFRHHFGGLGALERAGKAPALLPAIVQFAPSLWLALLVLLAKLALDSELRVGEADLRRLRRRNGEALGDEFITLAERTRPDALGLPKFGLVFPVACQPATTLDPASAVAVLCRLSGGLFLASASPAIPDREFVAASPLGLFLPRGGE